MDANGADDTGDDNGDDNGPRDVGGVPPMRATDDERRRVADELSEALGRGQIDLAEFEERTNRVWAARTRDELTAPLADLVPEPRAIIDGTVNDGATGDLAPYRSAVPPAHRPPGEVAGTSSRDVAAVAKAHVTGETGGSMFSVAVMFGADQSGDWVCPPTHYSVAMMGGVEVDLRRARFESHETEIVAITIMGGIEVIVPEDMRLTVQGTGLMGGFGSSRSKEVVIAGHELPPDAPSVRVTGVAIMGGVDVRRAPRMGDRELE